MYEWAFVHLYIFSVTANFNSQTLIFICTFPFKTRTINVQWKCKWRSYLNEVLSRYCICHYIIKSKRGPWRCWCVVKIYTTKPPPPLAVKVIANLFIAHLRWGRVRGRVRGRQTDRRADIVVHREVTLPKIRNGKKFESAQMWNLCINV